MEPKVIERLDAYYVGEDLSLGKVDQSEERCRHRLFSVVPVVSVRVEGGYVGRCLLCGASGPVRGHGEAARKALLEQIGTGEGRRMAFSTKVVPIHRDG